MSSEPFKWKTFFKLFYDRIFEAEVFDRGAQVAFFFSFSLFPLIFFLISLAGFVLGTTEALKSELFSYLGRIMPWSAFDLVQKTIEEIIEGSTTGKLTIGLLATLWSASIGIDSLRSALNAVYKLQETRPWWKTKLQSLSLTVMSITLIALALGVAFYGLQLIEIGLSSLKLPAGPPLVAITIQWLTILIVMLFACEVLFNLVPAFRRFRWIWITPGTVVAIFLWILFTAGFRTYLGFFDSYNRTYGSLGAVIILLLWLYLTAVAVLLGGAINAVYEEIKRYPRSASLEPEPPAGEVLSLKDDQ
jgi:membrane protein